MKLIYAATIPTSPPITVTLRQEPGQFTTGDGTPITDPICLTITGPIPDKSETVPATVLATLQRLREQWTRQPTLCRLPTDVIETVTTIGTTWGIEP